MTTYKMLFEVVRGYIGPLWAAHDPEANPSTVFVRRMRAPKSRLASLSEAANRARDISDPPLPRIFAITTEGDQLDIVMPWAEGEPLSSLMRGAQVQRKPIAPAVASSIAMQLLEQLVVLHEARGLDASMRIGGIHPDSVFVGTDGQLMLLDVCVAAVASRIDPWRHDTGRVGYIAPEQLASDTVLTDATDVFVVGILLWEMVMNRRLFPGASYAAVRDRIKLAQVPRVDEPRSGVKGIPKELADLIARALSVEPDERHTTARELRDRLRTAGPIADASAVGAIVEQLGSLVLRKRRTTLDRAMKAPSAGPLSMGGQRQSVPPRASSVPPRASSVPPRASSVPRAMSSSRPPAPNTTPTPPVAPRSVPPAAAPPSAFSSRRTTGPVQPARSAVPANAPKPPSPPRPPSVRMEPPPAVEPSPAPAPAKLDVSKRPLPPSARIQPSKMVAFTPPAGQPAPAAPAKLEIPRRPSVPPAPAPAVPERVPAPPPAAEPQAPAAATPVPVAVAAAPPQAAAQSAEPPAVEEPPAPAPTPPAPEAAAPANEANEAVAAASPLPVAAQPPSLHPEPLSGDVALAQDLPIHRPPPAASEVDKPAAMRGRPKIPRNVLIGGGAAAVALVALIIAFSGGDKDEPVSEQAASKPAPERTEARPAAPKPAAPPPPVEAKAAVATPPAEPKPAAEEPAAPEPKEKEEAKPEPAEEPAAESQPEEKRRKRREPAVVAPSEPAPKARHRPAPGSGSADESYKPGGI